jgi:hypothetical protein
MRAYALATSVFVGVQPVFTHVPLKSLRSMIATFQPAATTPLGALDRGAQN